MAQIEGDIHGEGCTYVDETIIITGEFAGSAETRREE
jgi:hypothetical protein